MPEPRCHRLLLAFLLCALLCTFIAGVAHSAPVDGAQEERSPATSHTVHSWETGEGKSYLIPAWEVPAFLTLLNLADRAIYPDKKKDGQKVYYTDLDTLWHHVSEQNWTFDKDKFDVNQFGHPYEGATMYGLARSAGLNFWQSALYSNVGSFLWEMGGETTRPSLNDIITTGNAGSLFGEALFRMANLVLEDGGTHPDLWHELGATFFSPPTTFNRYVFGDRFKTVFPSNKPATFWRCAAGASLDTDSRHFDDTEERNDSDAIASFALSYGLPGKAGYTYKRPLDYFDFLLSVRARASHILDALAIRGLLVGTKYDLGEDYSGIWGLYGSYDYLAPYLYRAASTALSLGTTGQYRVAPGFTLQGSLLGGYGFGAAGTDIETPGGRGYHYGGTPQGLLALKLIYEDKAEVDLTGRAYYVSDVGSDNNLGEDLVFQGRSGVTVRIAGRHAVGVQYVHSRRYSYYHKEPDRDYSEGTISLVYTYLSDHRFGTVQ